MDFIYLFTASIEDVNRRLESVRREGWLPGTGLLALDVEPWKNLSQTHRSNHTDI